MEQILKEIPAFFEDEQVQEWCRRSNQNQDTGYFSQVGSGSVPDVKGILPEFQIERRSSTKSSHFWSRHISMCRYPQFGFEVRKKNFLFQLLSKCQLLVGRTWELCIMKIILQNYMQNRSGNTDFNKLTDLLYQSLTSLPKVG